MDAVPGMRQLASIEGVPCVTLYLNTRLGDPVERERARQFVHRRVERALRAAENGRLDAREDLGRVRDEALRRVELPAGGAPAAVAIFSCVPRDVFRVIELEVPVEDQLVVADAPALKQLAALSDEYERTLLVLVSAEDARIFEILLGRVAVQESVTGQEVNQHRAPRTSPGWQQLHYQRQVRERIEKHLREVVSRVVALHDRDRPPRLVVGGAQPTIDRFLHELPDRLRTKVIDVVALPPQAPLTSVIYTAMEATRDEMRARELDGVRQTVDLALAGGPAALGLDEVLDAARQQRLMTLYLDPDFRASGVRCEDCGALARARADGLAAGCLWCDGRAQPVELAEALVRQAILLDGEVDFVPRNPLLERFEGIGAKLRW